MKQTIVVFLTLFVLTSCSTDDKQTSLTIKPVELDTREKTLLNKTGTDHYQFFELNGSLAEKDDLIYSSAIYKNGEKVSNGMQAFGVLEHNFQNGLVSFSLHEYSNTLIMGTPNGTSETKYEPPEDMQISGFRNNINEQTTLEKDKTVYLAYWSGVRGNSIKTSMILEPTKVPKRVTESDYAIVLTITLVDDKDIEKKLGD